MIRCFSVLFNCRSFVARATWFMLGSARGPRALAFPGVCKRTVVALHFVHNSSYPVSRWSVFWLSETVAWCSNWFNSFPNAELLKDTTHSIWHTSYVGRTASPKGLSRTFLAFSLLLRHFLNRISGYPFALWSVTTRPECFRLFSGQRLVQIIVYGIHRQGGLDRETTSTRLSRSTTFKFQNSYVIRALIPLHCWPVEEDAM